MDRYDRLSRPGHTPGWLPTTEPREFRRQQEARLFEPHLIAGSFTPDTAHSMVLLQVERIFQAGSLRVAAHECRTVVGTGFASESILDPRQLIRC